MRRASGCAVLWGFAGRRKEMWQMGISGVLGLAAHQALGRQSRAFSFEVFVSRLSSYTTDEEFRSLFSRFGRVEEVRLIRDRLTGRPKGYGFVKYGSEEEAQRAIKAMDGRIISGRLIFAEIAKSEDGGANSQKD